MPLPVISDVWRLTLDWNSLDGIQPRNVLHVETDEDDATALVALLEAEFDNNMFLALSSGQTLETITCQRLNGSSAGVVVPVQGNWHGADTGQIIPAQALVLSIYTAQAGPRGRGRLYLGPVGEQSAHGGMWSDLTSRNLVENAWRTFADDLDDGTTPVRLGVASYAHADFHVWTGFRVKEVLGTQRRRQDQLR